MEDPTATTIEFLRARLLAERSVSRTARQRAYELAKRVTELEKQLKFVSLQRKKAEKATENVLAILENHGRSDISETFDSSSDHEEISSDFKDGKQVETSQNVKICESDTEGFSGSEVESSSVNGKSLSWKSSKNSSSRFLEKKYMDASRRRRSNSFTSNGSSPRRVGKSCRQIRRREHRSVADVSENDDATNTHREGEGQMSSEGVQTSADVAIETSVEKIKTNEEKEQGGTNGHTINNHGAEEDMERALEHQAKFIARYEAEEKAQREWEDKFRENNGSTPDSCDPGTHSDVTEERDEIKAPVSAPDKLTSETQEISESLVDANEPQTARAVESTSHIETELLPDQKSSMNNNGVSDNQDREPALASGMSNERTLGTHENTGKLGSVLEALQQAKLSLKQNLENLPLVENGPPPVSSYQSGEKFPLPFSSTGLFRLPVDYEYTPTQVNSLAYDSRLSLTNYPTEPFSGRFISSPYRESPSRSAASLDERFQMVPTFPYQETRPGIPTHRPSVFDPRLDLGPSDLDPRLDPGLSARDPRLGVSPFIRDPRLDVSPSALHPRLDVGHVGPSALHPRLGMGSFARDPRLDTSPSVIHPRLDPGLSTHDQRLGVGHVGPSTLDPRLDAYDQRLSVGHVGPSTLDPRLDVGPSALNPRLDLGRVGLSTFDPRFGPDVGVGPSTFDPRLEMGSPIMGDRYRIDTPGAKIPRRTRSLYGDYTRPNTSG